MFFQKYKTWVWKSPLWPFGDIGAELKFCAPIISSDGKLSVELQLPAPSLSFFNPRAAMPLISASLHCFEAVGRFDGMRKRAYIL